MGWVEEAKRVEHDQGNQDAGDPRKEHAPALRRCEGLLRLPRREIQGFAQPPEADHPQAEYEPAVQVRPEHKQSRQRPGGQPGRGEGRPGV